MKFLEQLRGSLFWFIDFLKGSPIRKHYKEIKQINEECKFDWQIAKRKNNLQNLLRHTVKTVPYYRNLGSELNLKNFPVIDKAFVKANFDSLISKDFANKHNHKVTTSGSTGNPFSLYHDTNKRYRNTADTIYFAEKAGFKVGARLYYLRLWDKQYKKSNWLAWMQNISMHSVDDLDEAYLQKLVNQLESDKSTKNILAYVSALHTLCKYIDNKIGRPLNCKIDSVIGVAEGLNDYVIQSVKKYMGVAVLSRYSNSENGIIAQQEIGKLDFKINHASYFVEILHMEKDEPVTPGESGRIVITDLFNYCMPLIRYDTGDVGSFGIDSLRNKGEARISKIEGRKMDMFTNTKGEIVSSHIIHHILQYNEIDQFQFIEEENNEYIIKLKVGNDFDFNGEKKLIHQYKEYFGDDANIRVEYVKDIPLLLSGKRKLVINNAVQKLNQFKTKGTAE